MNKDKVLVVLIEPIDNDGRVQRQVSVLEKFSLVHCLCCVDSNLPNKVAYTSIGKYSKSKFGLVYLNIKAFIIYMVRFRDYDTVLINNIESSIFSFFLKFIFKKKSIIYDSHELAVPDPENGKSSFSKISRWLELKVISISSRVICANEERAVLMQEYYNLSEAPVVVPNYLENIYGKNDIPIDKRKNLVYQGVLNNNRYLEIFIRSFQYVENGQFHIVGDGPFKNFLKDLTADLGLTNKVFFHEKMPREILYNFIKKFKYGLVSYDFSNINNKLCAPNKVSEYVLNGVPILSTPQESLINLIDTFGIGLYFDKDDLLNGNVHSIAYFIETALSSTTIKLEDINKVKYVFDFDNYVDTFKDIVSTSKIKG